MATTRRTRLMTFGMALLVVLVAVGCESEKVIAVNNSVTEQLRVFIKVPGGGIDSVTPSPGNSSEIVAPENGTFYAFGVVDTDWLATIRTQRDYLQGTISDPATLRAMDPQAIHDLYDKINYLTGQIRQYQENPLSQVGGCSAEVNDNGATITIELNPAGGFPAYLLVCAAAPAGNGDNSN